MAALQEEGPASSRCLDLAGHPWGNDGFPRPAPVRGLGDADCVCARARERPHLLAFFAISTKHIAVDDNDDPAVAATERF